MQLACVTVRLVILAPSTRITGSVDDAWPSIQQRYNAPRFAPRVCTLVLFITLVAQLYYACLTNFLAGFSLIYSNVKPVSGGICAICVFTNGSNAKEFAITRFGDQITFNFSIYTSSLNLWHSIGEVFQGITTRTTSCTGISDTNGWIRGLQYTGATWYHSIISLWNWQYCQAIKLQALHQHSSVRQLLMLFVGTSTVTGLSAVLGLTLMGLFIAVLLAFIFFIERRSITKAKKNCRRHQSPNP